MADKTDDSLARFRAAQDRAWWRDLTDLVDPTDVPFAVLGPRGGATEQEIVALGAALVRWRAEYAPARHIWGLSDLLAGRRPRTPPPYIAVPFPTDDYENRYEPVALAYVANGTDLNAAAGVLCEHLRELLDTCAWIIDPDTYSDMNR